MVRNYVRKTKRQSWTEEAMKNAVMVCVNKQMGYRKAASAFDVPESTLERRVKTYLESGNKTNVFSKGLGKYKMVFNSEQEIELVAYIKSMEARLFGLTNLELRGLAFQLAEKNNLKHPFQKDNLKAGKDWLYGFMKRHTDLSLQQPEATSAARASGFNKVAVSKFYALLTDIVDKYKLWAHCLCAGIDEKDNKASLTCEFCF